MSNTKKQAKPTETQSIDLKTRLIDNYQHLIISVTLLLCTIGIYFIASVRPLFFFNVLSEVVLITVSLIFFGLITMALVVTLRHREAYQGTSYEAHRQLQLRCCLYILTYSICVLISLELM